MKENKLGAVGAIWSAFINRDLSYYPRFHNAAGTPERMAEPAILEEIAGALSHLKAINSSDLKSSLERGRESLDEVKSLTEYQDQKVTRVLTIVTFLSALSGALFPGLLIATHCARYSLNKALASTAPWLASHMFFLHYSC